MLVLSIIIAMNKNTLGRLEKYIEATSLEKMDRVSEVGQKYVFHKVSENALEACLLQVPIVEIWLSLILEHKLLLFQYENEEKGQYFNFDYKTKGVTTLSHLIKAYKTFFDSNHQELDLFKKKRNDLSHFVYDKELPTMDNVEQGDKLIDLLKKLNRELYDEVTKTFNLPK